jgi:hypothetical protein
MASSDTGRPGDAIQGISAGPKTRLQAVGGTPESTDVRKGREEAGSAEGERRGLPVWLFVLVFVLFALALVWQVREARRLQGAVATLEQDLAEAQTLLSAHRDHLGEIRNGVEGLSERLGALRRLVETGPEAIQGAGDPPASIGFGSEPAAMGSDGSPAIPARLSEP